MPSTVIRRFDYDSASRRLEIEFQTGRRYAYLDVPEDEVTRMRQAFAKGVYFNRHIRDRYACERLG